MKLRHQGLSLVELLVVIAVLSILIALVLPAVQRARDTSRRIVCTNNFKQLGLAFQNYAEIHNRFPPVWIPRTYFGWNTFLLPELDQGNLYNRLNFNAPWTADAATPQLTQLRLLRCAADNGSSVIANLNVAHVSAARSNYPFVGSVGMIDPAKIDLDKLAQKNEQLTSLVGKRSNAIVGERRSPSFFGSEGGDTLWIGMTNDSSEQGRAYVLGDVSAENLPNRGDFSGFSSLHSGGVQFLFADGSVRFISDNVDLTDYLSFVTTGF